MEIRKRNQSILDQLINLVPELRGKLTKHKDYVDPIAANSLYSVWKNSNKLGDKTYRKPATMGQEEVRRMADIGLIKVIGNKINITDKGERVIRVMVLGDDRSVYEEDGRDLDYSKALSNTKEVKTAKINKAASTDWWSRFERK